MARKAALIFLALGAAQAHHSFAAEYDANKPVTLDGVITRFDFVNPHAEIYMDVGGERWWIEAASPAALARRGISKAVIKPQMRVIVHGFAAKNGLKRASGRTLELPDGRKILLDASGAGVE